MLQGKLYAVLYAVLQDTCVLGWRPCDPPLQDRRGELLAAKDHIQGVLQKHQTTTCREFAPDLPRQQIIQLPRDTNDRLLPDQQTLVHFTPNTKTMYEARQKHDSTASTVRMLALAAMLRAKAQQQYCDAVVLF